MMKKIYVVENDIHCCITNLLSFPNRRSNFLPICLNILSFNHLTDKVKSNVSLHWFLKVYTAEQPTREHLKILQKKFSFEHSENLQP